MNATRLISLALVAGILAACGPTHRTLELRESRSVTRRPPVVGATSAERFGPPRASAPTDAALDYTLPPGWQKLAPSQFRDINLSAPGGVDCWVSILPAAMDALAHLTRWHTQLGLPAPTQADVDALPKVTLLGAPAWRVDGTHADGSTRIVGSMLLAPQRHVFVKMQGAPAAVEAQLEALAAFEASLRFPDNPSSRGGEESPTPAPDIRWQTPAGWTEQGPGQFKLVQFEVQGGATAWLTLLTGDGGGLLANLERWCGQVGHAQLSLAEIDALARWDVLGAQALYVPLFGSEDAAGLLAVIVPLETHALFVRMSGPSAVLRAHEAEFKTFCQNLER